MGSDSDEMTDEELYAMNDQMIEEAIASGGLMAGKDYYKSVDKNGRTVFSQHQPSTAGLGSKNPRTNIERVNGRTRLSTPVVQEKAWSDDEIMIQATVGNNQQAINELYARGLGDEYLNQKELTRQTENRQLAARARNNTPQQPLAVNQVQKL